VVVTRMGLMRVQWLQRAPWNVVPLDTWTASHITRMCSLGSHPKTPGERATTKKYNMHVEDYKPYLNEGDTGNQAGRLDRNE
uniref:Uncharacterized protein n=1 Tax=Oryctolagus cuniculus TaxID=9986 RepID=A0A5F9DSY1_RABIT